MRGVAAAHPERAQQFATEFGLEVAYADFAQLLADPAVTVVDLGVPNHLHEPFAIAALRAGKHVIVEKPLTGCFTPRAEITAAAMQAEALRSADAMLAAADAAGRHLCYAENWLYAPPFVKAERLLDRRRAGRSCGCRARSRTAARTPSRTSTGSPPAGARSSARGATRWLRSCI